MAQADFQKGYEAFIAGEPLLATADEDWCLGWRFAEAAPKLSRHRELIGKLAAVTEGCRELDGDVAEALSLYPLGAKRTTQGAAHHRAAFRTSPSHVWLAPRYTTSIDCALMLIKGLWTISREDGPAFARLLPPKPDGSFVGQQYIEANAATPPLAICIVAAKVAGVPAP